MVWRAKITISGVKRTILKPVQYGTMRGIVDPSLVA